MGIFNRKRCENQFWESAWKLEEIIPDVNDYNSFGVIPALDACQSLSEILHGIIAGETLERAVEISQISLGTITSLLETETGRDWTEHELKESEDIQGELDIQWQVLSFA